MPKILIIIIVLIVLIIVVAALMRGSGKPRAFQVSTDTNVVMRDGTYTLDTVATTMTWHATKVGGSHTGNIKVVDGELAVVDGTPATGRVTIDMGTITDTDISDAEQNQKLVDHLKSPDFFDVTMYPSARLSLAGWHRSENGLIMDADITIKNATKRISIPVAVQTTERGIVIMGQIVLDQSDFAILTNSALSAVVHNTITIDFSSTWNTIS